MRGSSFNFFATTADIANVIKDVEHNHQMFYVKSDLSKDASTQPISTGLSIPALGQAANDDTMHCPAYVVTQSIEAISIRAIPQRSGGVLFAVDQLSCPHSIILRPGGLFDRKAIISGSCGTTTNTDVSKRLFTVWSLAFKDQFRRVRSFMVGPEAERLLDEGFRLTSRMSAPQSHDLSKA